MKLVLGATVSCQLWHSEDVAEITYESRDPLFSIRIKNINVALDSRYKTVKAQLFFEADSLNEGRSRGWILMSRFFDALSFVAQAAYCITELDFVVEFDPEKTTGLIELYKSHKNPYDPTTRLDRALLESAAMFLNKYRDKHLEKMFTMHNRAMDLEDDGLKFLHFWYCTEIHAGIQKAGTQQVQKCNKCTNDLICKSCGKTHKRKPFPTEVIRSFLEEAIAALVREKLLKPVGPELVDEIFKMRHALSHGATPLMTENYRTKLADLTDILGMVSAGLTRRYLASLISEVESWPVELTYTHSYHNEAITLIQKGIITLPRTTEELDALSFPNVTLEKGDPKTSIGLQMRVNDVVDRK